MKVIISCENIKYMGAWYEDPPDFVYISES